MKRLGIEEYDYKSSFYLSREEKEWAKKEIGNLSKPMLAICTKSKELVKNWPEENWLGLIQKIKEKFSIFQLGDSREPVFDGVLSYAGKLSMRESAALLSHASYFIGPDSLLMHIANGLNIPSTIIFGGSRPVECFGYSENINLRNTPPCSPCWIHKGYESCDQNMLCMHSIIPQNIYSNLPVPLKSNKIV